MSLTAAAQTIPAKSDPFDRRTKWIILAMLAVFAACHSGRWLLPYLIRQDLVDGDACQHIWWTYRFADPQLFPNDPIAAYFSHPVFAPWGWRQIYRFGTPLMDAQRLSETIPLVLAGFTWVLAYLIGKRLSGSIVGGVVAVGGFAILEMTQFLAGGFARSFALPLLMLGFWALLSRRLVWLGLMFLLGVLLYPPVVITMGLTTAVVLSLRLICERRLPKGWIPLLLLGGVSLALLLSTYTAKPPTEWLPKTTGAEARTMPEFGPEGRSNFFDPHWQIFYFIGSRSGIGVPFKQFVGFSVAMLLSVILLRRLLPLEAWVLLAAAFLMFVIAHLTLFKLYLPNRQTTQVLPFFTLMWIAATLPRLIESARQKRWLVLPRMRVTVWACVALTLVLCGREIYKTGKLTIRPKYEGTSGKNRPQLAAALTFIRFNTPKDVRVAAHPNDADWIPLLALRSVVANRETDVAYYKGFYKYTFERIEAELAATYAADWADVDRLYEKYGATLFVVNNNRYTDLRPARYYAPHQAGVLALYDTNHTRGFVLQNPPPDRVVFRIGEITVVRVGPADAK